MKNKNKYNILVVDDQQNWREVIAHLLVNEGYRVKTVPDLKKALKEIEQYIFDLILLDVRLEDKNMFDVQGLDILRRVKAQEKPPRLVVLSGYLEVIRKDFLETYQPDKVFNKANFDVEKFKIEIKTLFK